MELYENDRKLLTAVLQHDLMTKWTDAFPGVDVTAEIRKAHAWEISNPKRRKKDKVRFLNNWLARQQDSPRRGQFGAEGSSGDLEAAIRDFAQRGTKA